MKLRVGDFFEIKPEKHKPNHARYIRIESVEGGEVKVSDWVTPTEEFKPTPGSDGYVRPNLRTFAFGRHEKVLRTYWRRVGAANEVGADDTQSDRKRASRPTSRPARR